MNEFAMRRTWGPNPRYENVLNYIPDPRNDDFIIISGPCSVESREQIEETAHIVSMVGATHLRGGVYRAGTYPGKNFGLQMGLLSAYKTAARIYGLQNIVEVLDYRIMETLDQFASCYQVGCRQMQNYDLLREVGRSGKPVFLKRHPGASIDEFLGAAEYVLQAGCKEIYLIERGSSTNARHVRWDLSISMIPAVQAITKIPIIVDGSHGTGRRDLVAPMTLAGVAAGANGILVETHPDPANSLSDADQAISFVQLEDLINKVEAIREAIK